MNQLLQHPSAIAATMAALFLLYLVIDKVAVPLLRAHMANNGKLPLNVDHPMPYRCEAGKFETRISTLEADQAHTANDVAALDLKLDTCITGVQDISEQTAVIYERVEWMHKNRNKRDGDGGN